MDVVDSCVDCVTAYVRQYTDRNKVLHQCMYVAMVWRSTLASGPFDSW